MRLSKKERQAQLLETIQSFPFITDEELAAKFLVSIQTIRLDRMELSIPELRARIKSVAKKQWDETLKSLPQEDVIGEVIDLELDQQAISILDITQEHLFTHKDIARGHYLFAQANSLAVAVINDELALTAKADIRFIRQVTVNERVVCKATVKGTDERGLTIVHVLSTVSGETVIKGTIEMYRESTHAKGDVANEGGH
ncbi:transcription factor FapR [Aureibacillus halotolerans]|uniref:Transcription factor FapR n=1 Tax=Aureibacillus halotolerans TaxID=1508390 RepID=A0A4R6U988_9BACI|nr:transcription factor FapR [Aureibacillus halotolerans]TDQ42386.1 acyl-coenzyme A thioesterase PaaI-like protein [Aureibacillus halotolerans]